MIKLIFSELKKIFKSKANIVLLMAFFGFYTFTVCSEGMQPITQYALETITLETFTGEPINTVNEFYAYADRILSQYEGEVNEELWQRYMDDYNRLYDKFISTPIDDKKMAEIYGNDWKELMQRNESGTLSRADIERLNLLIEEKYYLSPIVYSLDSTTDDYSDFYYPLRVFHEDEAKLFTLNAIYMQELFPEYYNETTTLSNQMMMENPNQSRFPLYLLVQPQRYLTSIQDTLHYDGSHTDETNIQQFAKTRLSAAQSYGSTVSPSLFYSHLQKNNFLTLLILSILCANTFARERSSGMDQIIVSTEIGAMRITAAKIIANLMLALGIQLVLLLIALAASLAILPLKGLDLPAISQLSDFLQINTPFFSFKELILLTFQMTAVGTVITVMYVSLFSCFTQSRFLTIIVMFAILFTPTFLEAMVYNGQIAGTLLLSFPSIYYQPLLFCTSTPYLYDPLLTNGVWIKDVLTAIWAVGFIVACAAMLWKAKLHRVATK